MKKTLVLTGVTGKKSGGFFLQYLSENKSMIDKLFPGGIKAIIREGGNTDNIKKYIPTAKICVGKFEDNKFLDDVFENADTVVHIAGIRLSKFVVDAAVRCKVRRLILVHTTGVYSRYKSASEEYKLIDEYINDVCSREKIVLTICRPTMIYGNIHDNNIVQFIKMVDKLPIMPIVNGARYELQPVHYKDLSKAYYDILINEDNTANKNFNLSGKEPILLRDVLKTIGKNLNKKVHFISVPFFVAYFGAWVIYCISFGKFDYREKVQRLCEPRVFSHEDAKIAFGYNPISFEEGIVEEVEEYKKFCR